MPALQYISNRTHCRTRLLFAAILLSLPAVLGAQQLSQIPIIDAPLYTPGLGGGLVIADSIYRGDQTYRTLVPLYLYEGKYLFAHGTSIGVHLFQNDTYRLDILGRYRFNKLDPKDDAFFDGLRSRRQTVDGGLSGSVRGDWGELKLTYVTELLNRYDGEELDLTYRYRMDWGNWMISPFINLVWQDDGLTGYYYGVSEDEARADRPAYRPGDAINLGFGVNTSYRLTDHVFVYGNFGFQAHDSTILDSPLVADNLGGAGFVGAAYLFGTARDSEYVPSPRKDEWSWRINYGYTAKENIFPALMAGWIEPSEVVDTRLAGLTLGKLLQKGPRIDYYGKLAFFRHLERDHQDDFWSYAAYVMAMGKGYLPWTEKPVFRWGFGFGVSYADKIPVVEQLKQASRERNTSHLLNYLEFQVDFPIENLIESKLARDCYAGMTAVHRSGIFGTSDILGDVSGGSDWVTFHLECMR